MQVLTVALAELTLSECQRCALWQPSWSLGAGYGGSGQLDAAGAQSTPQLHGDMGTGPLWPAQGALEQECDLIAGDTLGRVGIGG